MKTIKLKISMLLLLLLSFASVQAQNSINAVGGVISGDGGTATYSVGQVFYTTYTSDNGSVCEGVQQPYEIYEIVAIKETQGIELKVSTYPNPTTDILQLKIDNNELKNISYQLFDVSGKMLKMNNISSSINQIDMSNYQSGTYFVKIISENQSIKEFKIIKN